VPACIALARYVVSVGYAPCPCCGVALEGLKRVAANELQQCPRCLKYLEGTRGRLWVVPGDRVARAAVFSTPLRSEFVWPGGCAVCGGPANRAVEYELDAHGRSRTLGAEPGAPSTALTVQIGDRLRVKVPHCGVHDDGARLAARGVGVPARILFRSYAFLRAVVKANGKRRLPMRHVGALRQSFVHDDAA
jgi:hypothetical protein